MIPQRLIEKLASYTPSPAAIELIRSVPTLLLVGISGAGKDTVKHKLLQNGNYHHIVSHTTRSPRRNHGAIEQNGVDYHFIDYTTAENMLDNHGYIEAKGYSNNVYGTSVGEFQLAHDEQKIATTDLEVQGVEEYMKLAPHSVRPVFLLPPSYEVWQKRVLQRYGDDHKDHGEDLKLRTKTAEKELDQLLSTSYFFAVINDNLEETVQKVDTIAKTGKQDETERQKAIDIASQILKKLRESV